MKYRSVSLNCFENILLQCNISVGELFFGMLQVQAGPTIGQLKPCQVDCHHYGSVLGDKADDPFNCHMYYVCFSWYEWSEVSFSCPEGEMFDTITKKCMKEGYICSDPCQKCSYDCTNPVMGQTSNFSNCSSYMRCNVGVGTPVTCPTDNPYFDGNICQSDYKKCCSCKPTCTDNDAEDHVLLPDYSNCTNFYLCVVSGVPDETSHGHCPSGNFDQASGACEDNAPCITSCTNKPPDDGCVDNLICERQGYFPRCTKKCDPTYFWCSEDDVGHEGTPLTCSNDHVIDPISMVCIPPKDCPV